MNVLENIKKIRLEKHLSQEAIAQKMNCDVATVSRLEGGKKELKFIELEKFAKALQMRVIDVITYPEIFVPKGNKEGEKVSVTFEVSPDKRDLLLEMINKQYNA